MGSTNRGGLKQKSGRSEGGNHEGKYEEVIEGDGVEGLSGTGGVD